MFEKRTMSNNENNSNTNTTTTQTSVWGDKVHETLKSVEINVITPSMSFFALVLVLAIIFLVPFIGALNVWPAYGWIYLLILMILYALIFWTIHGTASLGTLAFDTLALFLVSLLHVYCAVTLLFWLVMQPVGLTPLASTREFPFAMHAIILGAHIYRFFWDFWGVRQLVEVSIMVRDRLKMARRTRDVVQDVNGSDVDDEEEMTARR
jgi:hypothetical protein